MDETSKVYVLCDSENRIIRIDGGYSMINIKNVDEWTLIDEGYGYKYNLCQSNYLPGQLYDERGIPRYKLEDGKPVERTQEEMDADYTALPTPEPTQAERTEAQLLYTALMTDTLLEV